MFTTDTIWTITDTLETARDNALALLIVAIEDGNTEEIETLTEAVAGYQKALDEFENAGGVNDKDMWLVYRDDAGATHYQHWNDVTDVGGLIDPESGDDMAIVGWTTDDPDLR